ncbi:MAG: hypothetical protein KME21_24860 [Desmonostoc vinosum HA7617-LM4]|nr:hypothetical protein [Desmonostoc vinosum HA7617-LM4]
MTQGDSAANGWQYETIQNLGSGLNSPKRRAIALAYHFIATPKNSIHKGMEVWEFGS